MKSELNNGIKADGAEKPHRLFLEMRIMLDIKPSACYSLRDG